MMLYVDAKVNLGEAAMFFHLPLVSKCMRTSKKKFNLNIKNVHCTLNMKIHWKKPILKNIYVK